MKNGPENQRPRRQRPPDSIWERYLTGKLSLEDKEVLPALIKEIHQEIAQHLGKKADAEQPENVQPLEIEPSVTPPSPNHMPLIDVTARRSHIAKRRPIDPHQN